MQPPLVVEVSSVDREIDSVHSLRSMFVSHHRYGFNGSSPPHAFSGTDELAHTTSISLAHAWESCLYSGLVFETMQFWSGIDRTEKHVFGLGPMFVLLAYCDLCSVRTAFLGAGGL